MLKSCKLQVLCCMLQSCMHFYTADKMGPAGVSVTTLWLDVTKLTKGDQLCWYVDFLDHDIGHPIHSSLQFGSNVSNQVNHAPASPSLRRGCSPNYSVLVNLGAVSTRVFGSHFSVRDGAAAQLLPLLFSRDHAGQWRNHGRDNGREKCEWRRPLSFGWT
jgi:hypothetical protein